MARCKACNGSGCSGAICRRVKRSENFPCICHDPDIIVKHLPCQSCGGTGKTPKEG